MSQTHTHAYHRRYIGRRGWERLTADRSTTTPEAIYYLAAVVCWLLPASTGICQSRWRNKPIVAEVFHRPNHPFPLLSIGYPHSQPAHACRHKIRALIDVHNTAVSPSASTLTVLSRVRQNRNYYSRSRKLCRSAQRTHLAPSHTSTVCDLCTSSDDENNLCWVL